MKLHTKLTLITALITAGGVLACTLLIFRFIWRETEKNIVLTGIANLVEFCNGLSDAPFPLGLEDVVVQSSLRYQFDHVPGSAEYALTKGEAILSNNTGLNTKKILAANGYAELLVEHFETPIRYAFCSIMGQDYLLAYADISIAENVYTVSLVRNATVAMNVIRSLGLKCFAIGISIVTVAAILALVFTRRSLRPIGELEAEAAKIAAGSYKSRIPIKGRDEIAILSEQFNQMATAISEKIDELNETAERRRMFINGISHELKTPVTAIMARSETLLSREISETDRQRSLAGIYDQCAWIGRLSDKLSTLTMLDSDCNIEIRLERVAELFNSVQDVISVSLAEKCITLITECHVAALPMDIDLMRSALVNLLENAKRASSNGSQIELLAYNNFIEIKDYGHGIPKEEISRITEPFYMVDRSRSKKNGGVGLGLALVKRIAEAHNIDLKIISTVGKGSSIKLIWKDIDNLITSC